MGVPKDQESRPLVAHDGFEGVNGFEMFVSVFVPRTLRSAIAMRC